jgi:hypothetical protein
MVYHIPPMNFLQRFDTLKFFLFKKFIFNRKMETIYNKHVQKNMPDVKLTMQEATDLFQLLMTNTHPALLDLRCQQQFNSASCTLMSHSHFQKI